MWGTKASTRMPTTRLKNSVLALPVPVPKHVTHLSFTPISFTNQRCWLEQDVHLQHASGPLEEVHTKPYSETCLCYGDGRGSKLQHLLPQISAEDIGKHLLILSTREHCHLPYRSTLAQIGLDFTGEDST